MIFFQGGDISVFETNIRYVGGLLSAYALTGDDLFREKALHVAEKLTPAFKSPTGIPFALINMRTGVSNKDYYIRFGFINAKDAAKIYYWICLVQSLYIMVLLSHY